MSIIKNIREAEGYTQKQLAAKAGLSLRTIQRLEANNQTPKGHSLSALSKVFDLEPSVLQSQFISQSQIKDSDLLSIKILNISALSFFLLPFGNVILTVLLWRKWRHSKLVDDAGRKIINFQIIWTAVLCILLCVSPFVNAYVLSSYPLILIVLFSAIAINLIVIFNNAILISRNDLEFLNLHIPLL